MGQTTQTHAALVDDYVRRRAILFELGTVREHDAVGRMVPQPYRQAMVTVHIDGRTSVEQATERIGEVLAVKRQAEAEIGLTEGRNGDMDADLWIRRPLDADEIEQAERIARDAAPAPLAVIGGAA